MQKHPQQGQNQKSNEKPRHNAKTAPANQPKAGPAGPVGKAPIRPGVVWNLQRLIGNRATRRLIQEARTADDVQRATDAPAADPAAAPADAAAFTAVARKDGDPPDPFPIYEHDPVMVLVEPHLPVPDDYSIQWNWRVDQDPPGTVSTVEMSEDDGSPPFYAKIFTTYAKQPGTATLEATPNAVHESGQVYPGEPVSSEYTVPEPTVDHLETTLESGEGNLRVIPERMTTGDHFLVKVRVNNVNGKQATGVPRVQFGGTAGPLGGVTDENIMLDSATDTTAEYTIKINAVALGEIDATMQLVVGDMTTPLDVTELRGFVNRLSLADFLRYLDEVDEAIDLAYRRAAEVARAEGQAYQAAYNLHTEALAAQNVPPPNHDWLFNVLIAGASAALPTVILVTNPGFLTTVGVSLLVGSGAELVKEGITGSGKPTEVETDLYTPVVDDPLQFLLELEQRLLSENNYTDSLVEAWRGRANDLNDTDFMLNFDPRAVFHQGSIDAMQNATARDEETASNDYELKMWEQWVAHNFNMPGPAAAMFCSDLVGAQAGSEQAIFNSIYADIEGFEGDDPLDVLQLFDPERTKAATLPFQPGPIHDRLITLGQDPFEFYHTHNPSITPECLAILLDPANRGG